MLSKISKLITQNLPQTEKLVITSINGFAETRHPHKKPEQTQQQAQKQTEKGHVGDTLYNEAINLEKQCEEVLRHPNPKLIKDEEGEQFKVEAPNVGEKISTKLEKTVEQDFKPQKGKATNVQGDKVDPQQGFESTFVKNADKRLDMKAFEQEKNTKRDWELSCGWSFIVFLSSWRNVMHEVYDMLL